jgi:hypothetical protein
VHWVVILRTGFSDRCFRRDVGNDCSLGQSEELHPWCILAERSAGECCLCWDLSSSEPAGTPAVRNRCVPVVAGLV